MNKVLLTYMLIGLNTFTAPAVAAEVELRGKVSSMVTAFVKPKNNLIVTDDKGGWFDQGLEMVQTGGWDAPYEVKARLRIISTSRNFKVRLDEPLQISNAGNAKQVFRQATVALGADGEKPRTLAVGQGTQFNNPAPTNAEEDSMGYYGLTVSAFAPDGTFQQVAGTYNGVLSLTFEPIISTP